MKRGVVLAVALLQSVSVSAHTDAVDTDPLDKEGMHVAGATAIDASEERSSSGIEFHGLIEVEKTGGEDHTGAGNSDVTLATVELGVDVFALDGWLSASFLALHEEGEPDPWVTDEAHFTVGNTEVFPVYLTVGRMYVPYGRFESSMVSDPLTLEVGETREEAILLGFEKAGFYGSVYAFNSDIDDRGSSDRIENYGWSLGYSRESGDLSYDLGMGRINHIGASGSVTDALNDATPAVTDVNDYVTGMAIHGVIRHGRFSFSGEYIAAREAFQMAELAWRGRGAEPGAYGFEVGYDFEAFAGRESHIALAVQGTDEAVGLGLPEKKVLVALTMTLSGNISLALEYANAHDYGVGDGGTGNRGNALTLQAAVEF